VLLVIGSVQVLTTQRATGQGVFSGFLYDNGRFTDLVFAGHSSVFPSGINDSGAVVGYSADGCFIQSGGSVRAIALPNSRSCAVRHLNNSGMMVGWYVTTDHGQYGFVVSGDGVFKQIRIPDCISTGAEGINNKGQVVGSCTEVQGVSGFMLDTGGQVTRFSAPQATSTFPRGINDAGVIVGDYYAANQHRSFMYANGKFSVIDFEECANVEARAINDSRLITGVCSALGGRPRLEGFLFDVTRGEVRTFSFPGASSTTPSAINNKGQIVGHWQSRMRSQ
jgi:uncharacterized membrane protein